MQLIGQLLHHATFGKGVVTECCGNTVTVLFSVGEKKFLYPDAFSSFLTLKNESIHAGLQAILAEQEAQRDAERRAFEKLQERKRLLRDLRITPNDQTVFHITPEQESTLFKSWSVATGYYFSGYSRGKPRIPERMKPNSMCLLTGCAPGQPESERVILGAFMSEEDFLGSLCQNGIIRAHPEYRIVLKAAHRPRFWPYIPHAPAVPRWGRSPFKYLSNQIGEGILFDLIAFPLHAEHRTCAKQFYQYYCERNHLPARQPD